jgi:hypothetical protein
LALLQNLYGVMGCTVFHRGQKGCSFEQPFGFLVIFEKVYFSTNSAIENDSIDSILRFTTNYFFESGVVQRLPMLVAGLL